MTLYSGFEPFPSGFNRYSLFVRCVQPPHCIRFYVAFVPASNRGEFLPFLRTITTIIPFENINCI